MSKIQLDHIFALSQFIVSHQEDHFPFRTAYKITKLINEMQPDVDFFKEKYTEINSQYMVDGKVPDDKFHEYQSKIEELLAIEVDLPKTRFTQEELEQLELDLNEIKVLFPLIEETEGN